MTSSSENADKRRFKSASMASKGFHGIEDERSPPEERERAVSGGQPRASAFHSKSCGARRGQRANSPSSRASPRSIHSRSPHGGSTRRAPGRISARASDVALVWGGALTPLRKTSAGMPSAL